MCEKIAGFVQAMPATELFTQQAKDQLLKELQPQLSEILATLKAIQARLPARPEPEPRVDQK